MAAKSDTKKKRSPEIEVTWNGNVPEATYFNRNGYRIVAKVENGQYILTRYGWDEDPEKAETLTVTAQDTLRLKDSLQVKNSDTLSAICMPFCSMAKTRVSMLSTLPRSKEVACT